MSHERAERNRGVLYTLPSPFSDSVRSLEFDEFFRDYTGTCFSIRTADGWAWSSAQHRYPQLVATFRTRNALDALIENASEAALGRLFLDGEVELDGNVLILLSVAQYTLAHSDELSGGLIQSISRFTHHFSRKLQFPRAAGKQNWQVSPCPLDLPVSFFEPWLGSLLTHSYSAFPVAPEEAETAQRRSLDRACEWLEVDWRDRMLEVGCGWGSLVLHAAENYGAQSQGISSSQFQCQAATERICHRSLERRCAVEERDLRREPYRSREFDKIAHLGIFEQIGCSDLADYLRYLGTILVPGGLVLLHRLSSSPGAHTCITSLPYDFLADGISLELSIAERAGFDLIRMEDLTDEYRQTVKMWLENLLEAGQATRLFSNGYRAWMLYLIEIATCLDAAEAQVHRVLLKRRS